jgi:hypothetical protein
MRSDTTARRSKKIQFLIGTGGALLLAGFVLHWAAKPLAREYISRNEHGSVSTINESRKDSIQHVGDRISWLGLALIVVGSFGWVNQPEDEQRREQAHGEQRLTP